MTCSEWIVQARSRHICTYLRWFSWCMSYVFTACYSSESSFWGCFTLWRVPSSRYMCRVLRSICFRVPRFSLCTFSCVNHALVSLVSLYSGIWVRLNNLMLLQKQTLKYTSVWIFEITWTIESVSGVKCLSGFVLSHSEAFSVYICFLLTVLSLTWLCTCLLWRCVTHSFWCSHILFVLDMAISFASWIVWCCHGVVCGGFLTQNCSSQFKYWVQGHKVAVVFFMNADQRSRVERLSF